VIGPEPEPETETEPKALRVLIAEDNAVNQKVALQQLRRLGYRADVVANGLEALATLERIPYDVVLMDCQMPEMDGYEAARRIRQREQQKGLPRLRIVAMTANAMEGDREKCLAAGMDDFITKPVRVKELQAILERSEGDSSAPTPCQRTRSCATVNPDSLDRLRELRVPGRPDPLVEIIDLLIEQTPFYLQLLKAASDEHDPEKLRKAAHALKGSCGNVGVEQMAAWCGELEWMARRGSIASAGELVTRLEQEFVAVKAALEAERTR